MSYVFLSVRNSVILPFQGSRISHWLILGDPGADKGGEGNSKRVEKYIWNEEK